jgi:hypothetical protein
VPHKKGAQIGQLEVNIEVYMWQLSIIQMLTTLYILLCFFGHIVEG